MSDDRGGSNNSDQLSRPYLSPPPGQVRPSVVISNAKRDLRLRLLYLTSIKYQVLFKYQVPGQLMTPLKVICNAKGDPRPGLIYIPSTKDPEDDASGDQLKAPKCTIFTIFSSWGVPNGLK